MSSTPKRSTIERHTRAACIATLVALALIVWSIVQPTPIPVIVAMSVGQAVGTLSLAFYVAAIFLDLRRARVLSREASPRSLRPAPGEPGQ